MGQVMRKGRCAPLEKLLRYRSLLEDKAANALLEAVRGQAVADDRLQEALVRREAATRWKGEVDYGRRLSLERYQHALELESVAADSVVEAQERAARAAASTGRAQDALLSAANEVSAVGQRMQRVRKDEALRYERSIAEQVTTLWCIRNPNAGI